MSGIEINFEDKKINKRNFCKSKKLFKIEDTDINKILVSKKESYGTKNLLKYFIGYDDDTIRSLCIRLPQMIGYVGCSDSNKTMSFKVNNKKLLKQYTEIWEKISNLIGKKFDSEHVYGDNDKYITTKIKSYGDRVITNFQGKKIPKESASYKCFSLIMLDSVIKTATKYYPQTLLEECKYEITKNKMENLINDNLDLSSSDESDNESDNEVDDAADE